MALKKTGTEKKQSTTGTPTSLLLSIVCTIVIFALAEIQNTFALGDSFSMRAVLMSYVGLGLTLAFFWKRLENSSFLKVSCGLYLFGLWVSLIVTTLAPLVLEGDNPLISRTIFQQFGLGFVAASGAVLMISLLQGQKMSPGLGLSSLGALALMVISGGSYVVKPNQGANTDIVSHARGQAKEALTHEDEKKEGEGEGQGLEIAAHGEGEPGEIIAYHTAPAEHGGLAHVKEKGSKLKFAAKAPMKEEGLEHHEPAPTSVGKHHAADDSEEHEHGNRNQAAPKKPKTASLEHLVSGDEKAAKAKEKSPDKTAAEIQWAYAQGETGPSHWGDLVDDYRKCSVGHQQSPIDIPSSWPLLDDIVLDYKLTALSIVDTGHTIQFNVGDHNYATIGGHRYKLLQFHIHTPSEHTLDGRASPMEIHFVHKDEKNQLAVIGVMVEPGKEQKTFSEMWSYVPEALKTPATPRNKLFNILSLMPERPKVYRYRGSLTTPPCSENVLWSVAADKINLSPAQIEAFKNRYKINARPLQKREGPVAR